MSMLSWGIVLLAVIGYGAMAFLIFGAIGALWLWWWVWYFDPFVDRRRRLLAAEQYPRESNEEVDWLITELVPRFIRHARHWSGIPTPSRQAFLSCAGERLVDARILDERLTAAGISTDRYEPDRPWVTRWSKTLSLICHASAIVYVGREPPTSFDASGNTQLASNLSPTVDRIDSMSEAATAELVIAQTLGKPILCVNDVSDSRIVDWVREQAPADRQIVIGEKLVRRCLKRLSDHGLSMQGVLQDEEIVQVTKQQFPYVVKNRNVTALAATLVVIIMWVGAVPLTWSAFSGLASYVGAPLPELVTTRAVVIIWSVIFWTSMSLAGFFLVLAWLIRRFGQDPDPTAQNEAEDIHPIISKTSTICLVIAVLFSGLGFLAY